MTEPRFLDIPTGFGVYIARDHDQVLYIGYSANVLRRLATHSLNSNWWPHKTSIEWHPCRSETHARSLERRLIKELAPRDNTMYNFVQPGDPDIDAHSTVQQALRDLYTASVRYERRHAAEGPPASQLYATIINTLRQETGSTDQDLDLACSPDRYGLATIRDHLQWRSKHRTLDRPALIDLTQRLTDVVTELTERHGR
jgi:hypothetical protein